tara:strand:- start:83 stop:457 length:375 start_codon:yes stop_codon:yes gene_type:complete
MFRYEYIYRERGGGEARARNECSQGNDLGGRKKNNDKKKKKNNDKKKKQNNDKEKKKNNDKKKKKNNDKKKKKQKNNVRAAQLECVLPHHVAHLLNMSIDILHNKHVLDTKVPLRRNTEVGMNE